MGAALLVFNFGKKVQPADLRWNLGDCGDLKVYEEMKSLRIAIKGI
jgi:hypothetical protein